MKREYYNYWFLLDARDSYLIFFYGEPDGFIIDEHGKLLCFLNTEDLLRFASVLSLAVETEDPNLLNLDLLVSWLETKEDETVDCKVFLNAWNLFDDVSQTIGGNFDADRKKTQKIYDKLFWGNNLPAVTPEGKNYTPIWTKRELKIIREVLGIGLSIFREKLSCV